MILEEEFNCDMHGIYAHIFLQMIEEHGGIEAAKQLLATNKPQEGLYRLWELELLDHSM